MKDKPPFFLSQAFILRRKRACPSGVFKHLSDWVEIYQIAYVMFGTTIQFFFKLWITLQYHER